MEAVIFAIGAVVVVAVRLVLGRYAQRAGRAARGGEPGQDAGPGAGPTYVMAAAVLVAGVVLLVRTATDADGRGALPWIVGVLLVLVGAGMAVAGRRAAAGFPRVRSALVARSPK